MKTNNKQINTESSESKKGKLICCICGEPIKISSLGWALGNNAYPYGNENNNRCCDDCNWNIVIPTRIEMSFNNQEQ